LHCLQPAGGNAGLTPSAHGTQHTTGGVQLPADGQCGVFLLGRPWAGSEAQRSSDSGNLPARCSWRRSKADDSRIRANRLFSSGSKARKLPRCRVSADNVAQQTKRRHSAAMNDFGCYLLFGRECAYRRGSSPPSCLCRARSDVAAHRREPGKRQTKEGYVVCGSAATGKNRQGRPDASRFFARV